jgi:hypothetical protein
MADIPDLIVLRRHRDLEGRSRDIWVRRGLFALVVVVPLLALANVFGQRPQTSRAVGPAATVDVRAPARVRSGLLFEARFTVHARRDIENAVLVLGSGWFEGMTANTVEPSPQQETSVDGRPAFSLGPIGAGSEHVLYMQFQVNPTNVGRRERTVQLFDGDTQLAAWKQTLTVFP